MAGVAWPCEWRDRNHFFAVASQTIRRILVDYARSHKAAMRGGGETRLLFDDSIAIPGRHDANLLALDDALEAMSQMDPRQGRIVELRFFRMISKQFG